MKLEVGYIDIKDVQFSDTSKVAAGVLYVEAEAVRKLVLEDARIADIQLDIARPGESVRIAPVKDVIEPRCKVGSDLEIFPGMLGKVKTVGNGRTHVLRGSAVVTCGAIVGFQEGIIDMSGPGAAYTPFSETNNLVLIFTPKKDLPQHEYEQALRMAGFKVAVYLGDLGREVTPDCVETYETYGMLKAKEMYPDLPRVGYVQMLQTQGLLHDTYVYGVDMKNSLTTMINPTEVMDGAIVSGNCVSACDKNTTYHHQNNPVIKDLFAKHGKELIFAGMIITNENVFLMDKERSSDWTAKLCAIMEFDGVVITQEGFGNPDTDLMMNCKKVEAVGVPTVIVTDEYAGRDGTSQSLADVDIAANAVVTGGNANEVITLPKMDKVIGSLAEVDVIAGGFENNTLADGSIVVELQAIIGATNELGFSRHSAR
ncbi:MAG: glycine/sarcosine/betaine reductase component B subunit [Defluviitaleaceae bacterium]|nr:glycine/sarcosine/betaine reductase component B subunit [Defluviitaleaceae bacterium]